MSINLTPKQIVDELNKYIIGQDEAKRAVAIALRNRFRRSRLPQEVRDEITPKNIIMSGPTGVGKTEIARRLSKLMKAPFIKVEATKFTEVGYVGRDVESMVRDLVEAAIRMVKKDRFESVKEKAQAMAESRLISILMDEKKAPAQNPFSMIFGAPQLNSAPKETEEEKQQRLTKRQEMEYRLRSGILEDMIVEVEVADNSGIGIEIAGMGSDINLGEAFSGILPKKTKQRKVTVREARKILENEEAEKLIDMDEVTSTAIEMAEQNGIIFLDEIDKIAGKTMGSGPDVSREGVQRDILPIVEGSTVVTKYGPVKTDYMLFIAAGAFHVSKISDLIPELQGRFPIRVELKSLGKEDFVKILSQPENAITKQYAALLSTDGINLSFTDDALEAIAECAQIANETMENIGARRLHTIVENMLEDISFNAGDVFPPVDVTIDAAYVRQHVKETLKERNLSKFIL
ncbi:MAG: ATP-dependent protease ATPase subunit HslU [Christensenellaceae bacterium]|nr:ATP-dependent protease ATPase subunit HslU [Christensenellaceae bacterium]